MSRLEVPRKIFSRIRKLLDRNVVRSMLPVVCKELDTVFFLPRAERVEFFVSCLFWSYGEASLIGCGYLTVFRGEVCQPLVSALVHSLVNGVVPGNEAVFPVVSVSEHSRFVKVFMSLDARRPVEACEEDLLCCGGECVCVGDVSRVLRGLLYLGRALIGNS